MRKIRQQSGATLFVALIFLLIMTLFAVSSINMSTVNLKIVGNMQAIKQMEAIAQDAIEQMLSDEDQYGLSASASTITSTIVTANNTSFNIDVTVDAPICIDSQTASGYSAVVDSIVPEDNTWEIVAHATDDVTGATIDIHQGIEIRMLADNCPDP